MCKHYHLEMLIAASKNINIDEERDKRAADIIESGNFFLDVNNKTCEIMLSSGALSLIHLDNYTCSCLASSHGIPCVCLSVAKKVTVPVVTDNHARDTCNSESIEISDVPTEETLDDKIKRKLGQINTFVNCSQFDNVSKRRKRDLLQSLNQAHKSCIMTNFLKKSRKRKECPLFPNRKSTSTTVDHTYSTPKNKLRKLNTKINEYGSFKTSGRSKKCVRKVFS